MTVNTYRVALNRGPDAPWVPAAANNAPTPGVNGSLFIDADGHVHATWTNTHGALTYTYDGRHPYADVWAVAARYLP